MKQPAPKPLRDAVREARLFRSRALTGFVLICLSFLVLGGRFFYLQVVRHQEFITRSEDNRVKMRALPPNRGLIFDRHGRILADNRPAYRLELIPEQVADIDRTLDELAELVSISQEDRERFFKLKGARQTFQGVVVRLRLNESEAARFAVDRHRFPGVDIVPYQTRVYSRGDEFAHVLGYVRQLDGEDLREVDPVEYSATTHVGKTGVERYYERELHGHVGHERVETNVQGRTLGSIERTAPIAGKDIYLTIDAELQSAAARALSGFTGAVVAVEPASGDILALVSMPSYDPNRFVNGISVAEYQELVNSPDRPLFNRALQGGYEPGSTFKPYIALAGLELGAISLDHTVYSRGFFQLPGQTHRYRDWKREGHGRVDLVQAIEQSVNVFFYELAYELGIDAIHDYVAQFGFGTPTGIDLYGESPGILPSREWKQRTQHLPWYPGETVITGIGQGFTVATPLQLAKGVATIAARGRAPRLHLLKSMYNGESGASDTARFESLDVPMRNADNWEAVVAGMTRVVHGLRGTARAIGVDRPPYQIAGKTGTAQIYALAEGEEYDDEQVPKHLRHHALFIAFAPADSPRIAVAVVAEHGGGGARVAAPIARQVIDAWLQSGAGDSPEALSIESGWRVRSPTSSSGGPPPGGEGS